MCVCMCVAGDDLHVEANVEKATAHGQMSVHTIYYINTHTHTHTHTHTKRDRERGRKREIDKDPFNG